MAVKIFSTMKNVSTSAINGVRNAMETVSEKQKAKEIKNADGLSLKELRDKKSEMINEKQQRFAMLGYRIYELKKNGELNLTDEDVIVHCTKITDLNVSIIDLEKDITGLESLARNEQKCECGSNIPEGTKFCQECGRKVLGDSIVCNCGKEMKRTEKFCGNCGKSMPELIAIEMAEMVASGHAGDISAAQISVIKTCICGEVIQQGQIMCFKCGRAVN